MRSEPEADPPAALAGSDPDAREGGDLEYDLAHEAVAPGLGSSAEAEPRAVTQVANQTETYDGDYGYDLAHDLPKPKRPPERYR